GYLGRLELGRALEAMSNRWYWIVLSVLIFGSMGFLAGYLTSDYTTTATLIRNESPASSSFLAAEGLKFQDCSIQTLTAVLRSPAFLRQVASTSGLPVTGEQIGARCRIIPVPGTELLRLRLRGKDPQQNVLLLRTYAQEAVRLVQDLQSDEARQ